MTNANKQRGDRAERAVRDVVTRLFPGSFKTRAGFDDDLGDIVVDFHRSRVVLQVKDVASPLWRKWYEQLAAQVSTCRASSGGIPTLGGLLVHKRRGIADAAQWHAVGRLGDVLDLLDAAYKAGRADWYREGYDDRPEPRANGGVGLATDGGLNVN